MLQTLPNNTSDQRLFMQHEVAVSACCPKSKNPRPGSLIVICYRAKEQVLEVASLYAYLYQFVHGFRDEQGTLITRDMEGMLLQVAADCAQMLSVPVRVKARWHLVPHQQVSVIARGFPEVTQTLIS